MAKTRFILRDSNHTHVDCQGNPSSVVYLVPTEWVKSNVIGNLPEGVQINSYSDYTGVHHSMMASSGMYGRTTLETGDVTTW